MASAAQILANRRNAEKSTGPRTEEGKAVASQNAVKHGLLARRDVLDTEDQTEFDRHRELMLAELRPAGPLESMLAERIVSLSWRLKRVERMQNEALDCLLAGDGGVSEGENDELGSFEPTGDPALGRAAVQDFAGGRVLERLMVYERRIESSLYKTMSELHRLKLLHPFDDEERARYRELARNDPRFAGPLVPATPPGIPVNKTNPIPAGTDALRQPGRPGIAWGAHDRTVAEVARSGAGGG